MIKTQSSDICKKYVCQLAQWSRSLTARLCSTISRAPDSQVRGPGFNTWSGHILWFLLPLIQEGKTSEAVCYWQKYVHKVLVNHLGGLSLPRKSVVRLIDHPDMTLDVYRGRKTIQQQSLANVVSILFKKSYASNCRGTYKGTEYCIFLFHQYSLTSSANMSK